MARLPVTQLWMLGGVALAIPLSGWGALYPQNTWLQVGPVAVGLCVALPPLRRWPLSNGSLACIVGFLLLHLLAARWSYSFVPYDIWLRQGTGFDVSHAFGFGRNMFDRLVHFLFGVLMVRPISEIAERHGRLSSRWAIVLALLFVFGISSLYEIFEWVLTMTMAPADAGAYNGEQGDPFDSQKDMACAAVGAILAVASRKLYWHKK